MKRASWIGLAAICCLSIAAICVEHAASPAVGAPPRPPPGDQLELRVAQLEAWRNEIEGRLANARNEGLVLAQQFGDLKLAATSLVIAAEQLKVEFGQAEGAMDNFRLALSPLP